MLRLMFFTCNKEFAFVQDQSTLQPVPMGLGRDLWFEAKQEAIDAAIESGYWVDGDMARMH